MWGENEMAELKPCPFCKGKARLDFGKEGDITYWKENGFEMYTPFLYNVFCASCLCRTGLAETPETAIKLWNRRAGENV